MMICPYCQHHNAPDALVCTVCSRDIAVPASLLAERDHLIRKRDAVRDELRDVRQQIQALRPAKTPRGA